MNATTPAPARRALVTGGGSGIGAGITRMLRRDGVECTITGRSAKRPEGLDPAIGYLQLDFRDPVLMREAMKAVSENLCPDILVNNAGINIRAPIDQTTDHDLAVIVETNLTGPYRLTRACLPSMISRGWGRVVNITSIWSLSGNASNSAYCASKFGLDGFTVSLAAEVAHKGVLVNAVAPGYVATEALLRKYSAEEIKRVSRHIPAGRMASPDEIGELVAFLASDKNSFIIGQNICIDGGLTRTSQPLRRF